MAVPEQTPINVYTATGLTTIFPFAFLVFSAEDLVVTVAGVEKVSGVDYTVAGVGVQAGGTVTMTTAPTAGQQVQVFRRSKLKRDRDYQTSGDLLADSLDDDIDRLVLVLQELHAGLFGPLPAPNAASSAGRLHWAKRRASAWICPSVFQTSQAAMIAQAAIIKVERYFSFFMK